MTITSLRNPSLTVTAGHEFQRVIALKLATLALPVWFAWDPLLCYFAAVFFLVLGARIAHEKAPPQAHGLDKFILCGPVFVAVPMAVFATEHFLDPSGVGRQIPVWIPAHVFWVLLVGICMMLGALSIVSQKYAGLSAGFFGVQLICFEVLMHIPRVVDAPHSRLGWMVAIRDLSFSLGALSFAAAQTREWRAKGTCWLITVARVVIGMILIFFAAEDFLHPELAPGVPLRQQTPTAIPGHLLWGYLSGLAFVVAGVCLIVNKKARSAATWVGTLVFFLTVMIYLPIMVQHNFDIGRGLNPLVDVLLFSGAALCLAGSLRKPLEARIEQDDRDRSLAAVSPEHQSRKDY